MAEFTLQFTTESELSSAYLHAVADALDDAFASIDAEGYYSTLLLREYAEAAHFAERAGQDPWIERFYGNYRQAEWNQVDVRLGQEDQLMLFRERALALTRTEVQLELPF